MLVRELHCQAEPSLDELFAHLSPCDLVLVEGFRHADLPKLEVWRAEAGKPWLHPHDANVLALASDTEVSPVGQLLAYFHLDEVDSIADFILEHARPL
jgi:molybdopterin-guanine dinucleotide biosynthesis protein B